MLRSLFFSSTPPLQLNQDEQVLFPDTQKQVTQTYPTNRLSRIISNGIIQNNRETHYTKQMYQTSQFIYIQPELCELRYDFQKLTGYENDKIKFMTKVEVDQTKRQGVRSHVKIARQPIFAKDDVITFLLIFKWFPNSTKTNNKARKGSFATEKEYSSLRVRYNKNVVQHQQLLYMVFLLSQKIYIQDRFIDQFVNIVSSKDEIQYKQLNCLTILIIGGEGKQRIGNLASTMAETNKYQHYQFENISMYNSLGEGQKFMANNDHLLNRFTNLLDRKSNSSRLYDRSARLSVGSRQNLDDSFSKSQQRFNLQKTKKYFSAVEYLTASVQVTIQMIIFHLSQDRNPIEGGLRSDVVQELITQWPMYNTYGRIYKLNKQRIMQSLLEEAIQNYRLMISMQLQEVENVNPHEIFIVFKNFNDKVTEQFIIAAKEYISQSDYDSYLQQLQKELVKLQKELINNYATTKEEYGSRVVKNLEKQTHKNSVENYLLMKIMGKEELSSLDIAYKTYKQLIDGKLQQSFKEFLTNKFKSRFYGRNSGNYYLDQLNNIENRIEICQAKKKNLDSAIELVQKDSEQLQVMLKLLQHADQLDSVKSEQLIE